MDASDFADLANELQADFDVDVTADVVVERLRDLLPDADQVSITVRAGRRHETLGATDPVSRQLDERQYALGEGPCLEAATHDGLLRSGDVGRDRRWPTWGPEAAAAGARSLLSIPLHRASDHADGALNVYSRSVGRFTEAADRDLAAIFAIHAAHALHSAQTVSGLETALTSRHAIGVAQGILMATYSLSMNQSLALLRRVASVTNTKLRDVAAHVVENGELPEHRAVGRVDDEA